MKDNNIEDKREDQRGEKEGLNEDRKTGCLKINLDMFNEKGLEEEIMKMMEKITV